ncbi:MAG: hypothetical protein ACRCXB_17880 [Aeromonadaceae bacterium]
MKNLLNAIAQLNMEDRKEIYTMLAKEFAAADVAAEPTIVAEAIRVENEDDFVFDF